MSDDEWQSALVPAVLLVWVLGFAAMCCLGCVDAHSPWQQTGGDE